MNSDTKDSKSDKNSKEESEDLILEDKIFENKISGFVGDSDEKAVMLKQEEKLLQKQADQNPNAQKTNLQAQTQEIAQSRPQISAPGKKSIIQSLVDGFDIVKNTNSISKCSRISPDTQIFDLIRGLSMLWIIYHNESNMNISMKDKSTIQQNKSYKAWGDSWTMTFIETGFYAVDFFFIIGGYVSVLSINRFYQMYKNSQWWKYPFIYIFVIIRRYCRIFPSYFIMMIFLYSIFPYLINSGPWAGKNVCTEQKFWFGFN